MKQTRSLVRIMSIALALAANSIADTTRSYPPYLKAETKYVPPTTEQKLWALATCAVLTESNRRRHDLLGGCERTPKEIKAWQESLAKWWGDHSRADLLDTLKWIRDGGHRQEFDEIARDLSAATPGQIAELRSQIAVNPPISNKVEIVLKYKDAFGRKSITAWDYDRYVSLCGWGYIAGYLTEDEAWERIMPAARLLQRTFDSWEDLGQNHVVGREFWSWKHTQRGGDLTRQCYKKLITEPSSPWKTLPWSLDLNAPATKTDEVQNQSVPATK